MAVYSLMSSHPFSTLLIVPILFLIVRTLYRISSFHPLAHIPGPLLPRISSLYLTYHAWIGDEATTTNALHGKYGPTVRTGPHTVDISDGVALNSIYTEKGGFGKPAFYANFDIDGWKSIFSETDPARRAPRAKAVAVLFSTGTLRQGHEVIWRCVDRFVDRLKEGKEASKHGGPLDLLNLTRGLAIDAVTSYLFSTSYGALDEDVSAQQQLTAEPITAAGMVDAFVAVGRFWYLPGWAFQIVESLDAWWKGDQRVDLSMGLVDGFVAGVVTQAEAAVAASASGASEKRVHPLTSYPARLLQAGLTASETRAQCKDLIFAGTDSTGMSLATILFHLARQPECYWKLRQELASVAPRFDDLQSLPCLRGVVKEGLRLSMANPSRLPRVVPEVGWTFKGTYFPSGTVVGCTPLAMHLNPNVFEDPHAFKPERWLNPSEEMTRDAIPFGLGSRQCIARNLATVELFCAVEKVARADILDGARPIKDKIEILEWFNSHVVGGRIDLVWQ